MGILSGNYVEAARVQPLVPTIRTTSVEELTCKPRCVMLCDDVKDVLSSDRVHGRNQESREVQNLSMGWKRARKP